MCFRLETNSSRTLRDTHVVFITTLQPYLFNSFHRILYLMNTALQHISHYYAGRFLSRSVAFPTTYKFIFLISYTIRISNMIYLNLPISFTILYGVKQEHTHLWAPYCHIRVILISELRNNITKPSLQANCLTIFMKNFLANVYGSRDKSNDRGGY